MANCGPPGTPPGGATQADLSYQPFHGAPCTNLNQTVSDSGHVRAINLTYKFDPDRMVYATYSTGFRPGGVNRCLTSRSTRCSRRTRPTT